MSALVRTETRTITWTAVGGPRRCACGHDHYGWSGDYPALSSFAPQWGFCAECVDNPHHSLRRVPVAVDPEGEKP